MKSIFKFMSVALIAGALFVACDPETNPGGDPETPDTYTVRVNCNDATMGAVEVTPKKDYYEKDEQVTITATPNDGYKFLNWNENITDNPYTFTVTANAVYTAYFEALPQATYAATFDGVALDIAGFSDFQTNGEGIWLAQFAKNAEGTSVYFPYIVAWFEGADVNNFAVFAARGVELYKDTYYEAGDNQYGDWQYLSTNSMNCTKMDLTTLTLSFTGSFKMYDLGEYVNGTAETPDQCTQKDLSLTCTDCVFTVPSKGLRKMTVK